MKKVLVVAVLIYVTLFSVGMALDINDDRRGVLWYIDRGLETSNNPIMVDIGERYIHAWDGREIGQW